MSDGLTVQINGVVRSFAELRAGVPLAGVVEALGLKADRIAVELNGEIAPRTAWAEQVVKAGDRLEIVHFVGGGCDEQEQRQKRSRKGREV
jgi:sulfur carrier protein